MTIEDWLAMASVIEGRRLSAAKYAARTRHLRAFPHEQINVELDVPLLEHVCAVLKGPPHHDRTGFARPHRGARGEALQTPIIIGLVNRVMRLRAAGARGQYAAVRLIRRLPVPERERGPFFW
ncbi:MAG: hypothetical protein Q4P24_07400 [Rhodobacterales bacterium]|nr:hypothetical protein [Rhodobacterales bacterium]